jgi:hypothetical protein
MIASSFPALDRESFIALQRGAAQEAWPLAFTTHIILYGT